MASPADPLRASPPDVPDVASSRRAGRSLWWWVGGAFLFLALLWSALVYATRGIDTRTVPLQSKEVRK